MFEKNTITAFPTNTSWGLGVRADDTTGLENLAHLKQRKEGQMFSLMVRDMKMLREFAEIPEDFPENYFIEKPRTAILKPTNKLPTSKYWPQNAVAFRVSTLPKVAEQIMYPITATSANISGKPSLFSAEEIRKKFGNKVLLFPSIKDLPQQNASEIWNFTTETPQRLR